MPWLAQTSKVDTSTNVPGGVNGGDLYWFRPDADDDSEFTKMDRPTGVVAVKAKPSWDKYGEKFLGVGAWNENMVVTPDWGFYQQGIRPPNVVPTVVAGAGTGITGDIIGYLSYAEYRDGQLIERSALSAASATQTVANKDFSWSAIPTSPNTRVTHIEFWRSIDGSLPRLVVAREVGVTAVTEAITLADLGEAFAEDFDLFPRCKFNAVWHGRQVMAGDDQNPTVLYLSLIDEPERWSLLTLNTKSRQPIIGLAVVHDQLLVFCPRATERVSGFTEDDLNIEIAQPQIGAINHHAVVNIHGNLWIPTHLGIYMSDGTGWFFMMKDVWTKWVSEYSSRRAQYDNAWAYHDPVSMVYKLYVGEHSDCTAQYPGFPTLSGNAPTADLNVFWVGDYTVVIPQVGGDVGQPNWGYDTSYRSYDSGAFLSVPGARRSDSYLGGCGGDVFIENVDGDGTDDGDGEGGDGDQFAKRLLLITGADFHGDVGGDLAHGKRWIEDDMFVESEFNAWRYGIYAGNESIIPPAAVSSSRVGPQYAIETAASLIPPDEVYDSYEPETSHHFTLNRVVGRCRTTTVLAYNAVGMKYRGYQTAWTDGYAPRRPTIAVAV